MGRKYANIEFGEGYAKSFPEFEEDFRNAQVFKDMLPEVRKKEMKKAYKIATDGNLSTGSTKRSKGNTPKNK